METVEKGLAHHHAILEQAEGSFKELVALQCDAIAAANEERLAHRKILTRWTYVNALAAVFLLILFILSMAL
jgi:hypothetical protein